MSLDAPRRAALRAEALRAARDEGLEVEGRALPFLSAPLVVANGAAAGLRGRLDAFLRALWRLEELCLEEPACGLRERLAASLTADGRRLLAQGRESAYSMRRRFRRLDGFFDPASGGYSVIEVNQAAPIGSHFNDVVQRAASRLLAELGFDRPPDLLAPRLLDWLVGEYRQRHGTGRLPRLVVVPIEHGYPAKLADLPRMAAACEELSAGRYGERIRFRVCFAPELRLRRGRPVLGADEADLVWRNSGYLTCYRPEDVADYVALCSDPAGPVVVNSTRAWLTRTKEVFAILSGEDAGRTLGIGPEDLAAIRAVVPLTLNLGRSPERAREVLEDKDAWVSKPADSDFGQGVEFGANQDDSSWRALVRERSKDGFVFQRRVPCPSAEFPILKEDGSLRLETLEFDLCPYHVGGAFPGNLISRANRPAGAGGLRAMNVARGSLIVPVVAA